MASDLLWELCERVVSSEKDEFAEVYQWELDYFVAELCCDEDTPEANAIDVAKTMLQFANRAGYFMEIVPSSNPSSKWEKRAFNFNAFQEDRMSACVGRVQSTKAPKANAAENSEN